ncbi:MAG TPA: hypothetical protein VGN52_03325 [Burkholderiales bacterium]
MTTTTRVKALAERIYIDMVSRIALQPGDPDKAKPNPESIAKLSFKLAEAFMKVDDDSEGNAAPVAKYEVQMSDLGG